MENSWVWVADHDIDRIASPDLITVTVPNGLVCAATQPTYLVREPPFAPPLVSTCAGSFSQARGDITPHPPCP
eukprot:COSAG01_NODE_66892_length_268_cov_1.532544_1_plen_73_part_00